MASTVINDVPDSVNYNKTVVLIVNEDNNHITFDNETVQSLIGKFIYF